MLPRILAREGIEADVIEKIKSVGVTTVRQLFLKKEWELAQMLDLSVHQLQDIITRVCARIGPAHKSVLDMWEEQNQRQVKPLPTSLPNLDQSFHGGLPISSITEIAGTSGSGKTQFCYMVAALNFIHFPESSVVYFDTDNKFSAKRFMEVLSCRLLASANSCSVDEFMEKMHVVSVESSNELTQQLQSLEDFIVEKNVRLIIIDSIATLARKEFNKKFIPERQKLLMKQASLLKFLSETFGLVVIVTNHATSRQYLSRSLVNPALGNSWAHSVNNRITMSYSSLGYDLSVDKSPMSERIQLNYEIQNSGLVQLSNTQMPDLIEVGRDQIFLSADTQRANVDCFKVKCCSTAQGSKETFDSSVTDFAQTGTAISHHSQALLLERKIYDKRNNCLHEETQELTELPEDSIVSSYDELKSKDICNENIFKEKSIAECEVPTESPVWIVDESGESDENIDSMYVYW